jgi:hypothetical protein
VNCSGADATVVANAECSVPISSLTSAPFNLEFGDSVYAKVRATNLVGNSAYSAVGNGGVLLTTPGAPLSLANNVAVSTKTQIGLTWYEGISNGGTPVLDYRIHYKADEGNYSVLVDSLTDTFYTAASLITGTLYTFKV